MLRINQKRKRTVRQPATSADAREIEGRQATPGWAPRGFAAIPTAALDPPHSAASPAVPALIGSGSPSCRLAHLGDLLEFLQQIGVEPCHMTHYPSIIK
jgi:hypothetical protein